MEQFIKYITAEQGYICVGVINERFVTQRFFSDAAAATAFIRKQKANTYVAPATFLDPTITKPREQSNVHSVKSLWIDFDFKNVQSASPADTCLGYIATICTVLGFPPPTRVSTGGGFHVYWVLDTALGRGEWTTLALKFKAIIQHLGITADYPLIANSAVFLRPVETLNYKYNPPRQVTLDNVGPVLPLVNVVSNIDATLEAYKIQVDTEETASATRDALVYNGMSFDFPRPTTPLHQVVNNCAQMRDIYIKGGNVEYPLWRAALNISRFTEEGLSAAISLSHGYEGWSEREVKRQLDMLEADSVGPMTCAWFKSNRPAGCAGCEQNVKSPVYASYFKGIAITQATNVQPSTPTTPLPTELALPFPYIRKANSTGIMMVWERMFNAEDKELPPEVAIPYDVYASERVFDEFTQSESVVFTVALPNDPIRNIKIKASDVVERRQLAKAMSEKGIYLQDYTKVQKYMLAFIRKLQKDSGSELQVGKMGWRDNFTGFAVGPTVIQNLEGKVNVVKGSYNPGLKRLFQAIKSSGNLEDWKRGFDMYNRPGMEAFAFVALSSFATPLIGLVPGIKGIIVSLFGKTGQGKTWCAGAVNSVWGDSDVGLASTRVQDTALSKEAKMGVLNNLPVIYDESTNMDPVAVSSFCLNVSSGQGKDGMKVDNTLRDVVHTWATIIYTTTNNSWASKLSAIKGDAQAESMRVFEFELSHNNNTLLSKGEADTYCRLLTNNHGLAGIEFIKHLVLHVSQTKQLLLDTIDSINSRLGNRSEERYWTTLIAATKVAGEMAKQLGLHNYDVARVIDWAVEKVLAMRAAVNSETMSATEVLGNFLLENVKATVHFKMSSASKLIWDGVIPTSGAVNVRYEHGSNFMFVNRAAIRKYIQSLGMDYVRVCNQLITEGVLAEESFSKRLMSGMGSESPTTKAWVVRTDCPAMSGKVKVVEELISVKCDEIRRSNI